MQTFIGGTTEICDGQCLYKGAGNCVTVALDGEEATGCNSWAPTGATCSIPTENAPGDTDGDGSSDGNDGSPNNPGSGGGGKDGKPTEDGGGKGNGNGPGEGSGNGNTAGGGGNCQTPPSVTGDAALAMVSYQTWATRCAVEKLAEGKGNGTGAGGEGDGEGDGDGIENAPFNEGDQPEDNTDADEKTVHEHSFNLEDKLDMSGFLGGGSCPQFGSITMGPFGTHELGGQWFCDWLPIFRALIILMAIGTAFKILMGG